jgi:hypothetical protein
LDRRPTTQDITWLLDLHRNGQIDLEPPYQRRSVWTPKDRRFFLDTIFRNYPSPAIFLHKNISDDGNVKYFVVDGKQRLQTIFGFVANKLRMAPDYGDVRLDGKRWRDLNTEAELKHRFWNYQVPVEMIDAREGDLVRNVFDRLNRNSRRLTPQELRHAKFEGWFITRAEAEGNDEDWVRLGISTRARATRMIDVQFLSELMGVVLKKEPLGFGQERLDELYAEFEDLNEIDDFNEEEFDSAFNAAKATLLAMEEHNGCVLTWAKGFGPFYSLWSVIATADALPGVEVLAERYANFMSKVQELDGLPPGANPPAGEDYILAATYRENARGASTEGAQRKARHEALSKALLEG